MNNLEEIVYHESEKIGKGLPYAIVPSSELLVNDHIFNPSYEIFKRSFGSKKVLVNIILIFKSMTSNPIQSFSYQKIKSIILAI
tara:strand:+ start:1747 stop:1998 length:252 start_codon:yes stop_codon:yes gene_type:complete